MDIELLDGERIDDLHRNGYRIIQDPKRFCFGMDAVLLSGFASVKRGEKALDLGTGTGIIPILLEAKTCGEHFTALEIQEESADMARRSVRLNQLENKIEIVTGDIKNAKSIFQNKVFDVVTSNPPYMNVNHGLLSQESPKAIARHELLCTLDDVVKAASDCLKVSGRFYMVHRPHRLVEIFDACRRYKLEPKRMRMVQPYEGKEPNMVLIECAKCAKPMIKIEPPLIVYQDVNRYTREILEIYGYEENQNDSSVG